MPKKKVSIFPKENNNPLLGLASINDDGFETCAWIGKFMLRASNGFVCKKDFWKITGHEFMHGVEMSIQFLWIFNSLFWFHVLRKHSYFDYEFCIGGG